MPANTPKPITSLRPSQPRSAANMADAHELPLRLLQLTDLHLFGDASGQLLGITTRDSFEAVLELSMSAPRLADALILTGDLVHDETPAGYRYLRETLKKTNLPHFCVAGNHDRPDLMAENLGAAAMGPVALRRLGAWNLIFLSSGCVGSDGGRLAPAQIAQLGDLLQDNPAPALIFLHHHPLPIHSAWMDTMGVENGHELLDLCDQHPQVKGILFGHVHQAFYQRHGGCQILGAPSTCFQFMPGSRDFAIDDSPPGYRELLLYPDGRLTTSVARLEHYAERPLHQAEGY